MFDAAPYFSYALSFKPEEAAIRRSMMDWLPDGIIDVHAHCNLPEHVIGLDEGMMRQMMTTFPGYSLEDSLRVQREFYPGKHVRALRFPNAYRGIDHKAANAYLLDKSSTEDRVAIYGIPTDVQYTVTLLQHKRVSGLKMYKFFFDPPALSVYQFFPPEVLEEAQTLSVPIVLHLPQTIARCRDQLRTLLRDFPRLIVVLAHLGLPHLGDSDLEVVYREFASYERIFLDSSMVSWPEAVRAALVEFGTGRIMFGSDEPVHMIRSVMYRHPQKGDRLATDYLYHWVDKEDHARFGHLAANAIHIHWRALLALRQEMHALGLDKETDKEAVFGGNARVVFRF